MVLGPVAETDWLRWEAGSTDPASPTSCSGGGLPEFVGSCSFCRLDLGNCAPFQGAVGLPNVVLPRCPHSGARALNGRDE